MKTPLADFVRHPSGWTVIPNVLRGLLSLGAAFLLLGVVGYDLVDAYQLDRDGEIKTGPIKSVVEHTGRGRRGRVWFSYQLVVETDQGTDSVPSDSRLPIGRTVRYIYSPTTGSAALAPEPLNAGDILWSRIWTFSNIAIVLVSVAMAYYAYSQLWWLYVLGSGRYTVNGEPVERTQGKPTGG